jgi:DNA topoisomerase-3
MKTVIENLMHEAKLADMLILWLDCDLEGEAIAKEVEEICLRANAGLEVRRARFAALTKGELR